MQHVIAIGSIKNVTRLLGTSGKAVGAAGSMKHDTDTVMTVTAFGMFVYSTFTIISGVLNERSNLHEPGKLIVTNGIIELIEVSKYF